MQNELCIIAYVHIATATFHSTKKHIKLCTIKEYLITDTHWKLLQTVLGLQSTGLTEQFQCFESSTLLVSPELFAFVFCVLSCF